MALRMSNNLTSTDKLHVRYILLIIMIGLALHFPLVSNALLHLVIILVILTYSLSYSLSISNDTIFSNSFLRNSKVIKILLYVSSLTYTSMVIEVLNHYGLSTLQSTMFTISMILITQAISANLDYLLTSAWRITILDLHIVIFAFIATVINFTYFNNIHYIILLLLSSWLLFIRSTPSLIFMILPVYSLINSKRLSLLDVFIITPLIAYAYGYASAVGNLAVIAPCYDNKSLLAIIIVTTIASIFTTCIPLGKLMYIVYYVTLLIMFCYYVMMVMVGNKKISIRKRL